MINIKNASFLTMKTSIDYLHIPLRSHLGFTQKEGNTNPALVTTQIRLLVSIFNHFEIHFGFRNRILGAST